jgi:hypothetical protein
MDHRLYEVGFGRTHCNIRSAHAIFFYKTYLGGTPEMNQAQHVRNAPSRLVGLPRRASFVFVNELIVQACDAGTGTPNVSRDCHCPPPSSV